MNRTGLGYTNRLRPVDFRKVFSTVGFKELHIEEEPGEQALPKKLAKQFRTYPEDQLRAVRLLAILQKTK